MHGQRPTVTLPPRPINVARSLWAPRKTGGPRPPRSRSPSRPTGTRRSRTSRSRRRREAAPARLGHRRTSRSPRPPLGRGPPLLPSRSTRAIRRSRSRLRRRLRSCATAPLAPYLAPSSTTLPARRCPLRRLCSLSLLLRPSCPAAPLRLTRGRLRLLIPALASPATSSRRRTSSKPTGRSTRSSTFATAASALVLSRLCRCDCLLMRLSSSLNSFSPSPSGLRYLGCRCFPYAADGLQLVAGLPLQPERGASSLRGVSGVARSDVVACVRAPERHARDRPRPRRRWSLTLVHLRQHGRLFCAEAPRQW